MKTFKVFDIIGPDMIGPSSSHTAGAARIGKVACRMAGGEVAKAHITLYESFATTGRGHGTDKALLGGLLGFDQDDERLRDSFEIAKERGLEYEFEFSEDEAPHPNTARITVTGTNGQTVSLAAASVGGGNIKVIELDGMEVSFQCDYPTIILLYDDMPGIVQMTSTVLAKNDINIAFMRVFRQSKRMGACMVIETDEPVSDKIADLIQGLLPEIRRIVII
jgi:L-serine dehydratase